jgi:hypothetical protein
VTIAAERLKASGNSTGGLGEPNTNSVLQIVFSLITEPFGQRISVSGVALVVTTGCTKCFREATALSVTGFFFNSDLTKS